MPREPNALITMVLKKQNKTSKQVAFKIKKIVGENDSLDESFLENELFFVGPIQGHTRVVLHGARGWWSVGVLQAARGG